MELKTEKSGNVKIIQMVGEILGGSEAEEFRSLLYEAIEKEEVNIVVDLSKATWMNSSGLGMLVSGLSTIRSSGGDLRLSGMSHRVRRPLEITRLE